MNQVREQSWEAQCKQCPDYRTRIEHADIDPEVGILGQIERMLYAGCTMDGSRLTTMQWLTIAEIRDERETQRLRRAILLAIGGSGERPPGDAGPKSGEVH